SQDDDDDHDRTTNQLASRRPRNLGHLRLDRDQKIREPRQIHQPIDKPGSGRKQRQRNADLQRPSVGAQNLPAANLLTQSPTSKRNPEQQRPKRHLTRDSPQVSLIQTTLKQPKRAPRRRLAPRSVWLLGHNCHLNSLLQNQSLVTCPWSFGNRPPHEPMTNNQ